MREEIAYISGGYEIIAPATNFYNIPPRDHRVMTQTGETRHGGDILFFFVFAEGRQVHRLCARGLGGMVGLDGQHFRWDRMIEDVDSVWAEDQDITKRVFEP